MYFALRAVAETQFVPIGRADASTTIPATVGGERNATLELGIC